MKLPTPYQWLQAVEACPNTIKEAIKLFGVREISGASSTATILSWRDELIGAGVRIKDYSNDDIAWCGLFAAIVCYRRKDVASEVVKDPLWARNWSGYGKPALTPVLGDVLVFRRGSGGHVGFYVGEDSTCFHVLGGNQSDQVCITRIVKSRLLAARRPPYKTQPAGAKVFRLKAEGLVSLNES